MQPIIIYLSHLKIGILICVRVWEIIIVGAAPRGCPQKRVRLPSKKGKHRGLPLQKTQMSTAPSALLNLN